MRKMFKTIRERLEDFWASPLPDRFPRLKIYSRHPVAVPIITFGVLLTLCGLLAGVVYVRNRSAPQLPDTRIVIISHDRVRQVVPSRESSVGSLLQKLNIHLNEGDRVEPAVTATIDQDQFRINIYRAVPVQVIDNGNRSFAFSAATTPRSIAGQAGLTTYSEDYVTTSPAEDFVKNGSLGKVVAIDRATPVNVNLYGAPVVMRTHASTIRQLLAEKHIKLKKQDQVKPGIDASIATAGIAVVRNGISTVTVQENVAPPNHLIQDGSLAYGTSAVRQTGTPGKKAVTYQINTQNGNEISRTVMQTVMIQEPVAQITVVGTSLSGIKGDMALAGISPSDYQYADYIISRESGWCPTKAQGQYGGCPPYAGYVPATGGYGLCQSTPGSKMSTAGADWATNPVTQLRWCSGYATRVYGGWAGAYSHWLSHHNW
jgi:uncharacterized protein YabE (DUF348 family)